MGLSQRRKGLSQEYRFRDYLRARGWQADRVPSSGAAEGFKGDIKASKDGKEMLFELKTRKDSFKRIYDLYFAHRSKTQDDVLAFVAPETNRHLVSVSDSLDAVLVGTDIYVPMSAHPLYADFKRTFGKVANMEKLLGPCDVLVVKDDRCGYLFLRYR